MKAPESVSHGLHLAAATLLCFRVATAAAIHGANQTRSVRVSPAALPQRPQEVGGLLFSGSPGYYIKCSGLRHCSGKLGLARLRRGRGAKQSSAHVFSHAFSRVSSPTAPLGLLGLAGPRRRGEARCWPAAWLAAASPGRAAAPAAPARAAGCASARPAPAAGPAHAMYEIA